jgi:hypothetical protein
VCCLLSIAGLNLPIVFRASPLLTSEKACRSLVLPRSCHADMDFILSKFEECVVFIDVVGDDGVSMVSTLKAKMENEGQFIFVIGSCATLTVHFPSGATVVSSRGIGSKTTRVTHVVWKNGSKSNGDKVIELIRLRKGTASFLNLLASFYFIP